MSDAVRGLAPATSTVLPLSGMNAAPSARPWLGCFCANPDGWFDAARGTLNTESTVANMQRAGVRLARVEFPWFLIKPDRGSFDWRRVDHIVSTVKRAGMRLHVQVLYPPAWTATGSTTPGPSCEVVHNTFASGVPGPADYASFIGSLVRHVRDTNPGGLPFLEIGNEYDLLHYFNGTPADYVASQLIPGYNSAKAVDPTIEVLLAGWGRPTNTDWFQAVLDAGGAGHFDIVSFHSYGDGPAVLAAAASNRAYLDRHGFAHIPLWVSEFGRVEWGTDDTGHQAVMRAVFAGPSALEVAEWYEMHDDDVYGAARSICQREPFGLVEHDATTTKGGYLTWQALSGGGAMCSVDSTEFIYTGEWRVMTGVPDGRRAGTSHKSNRTGSTATLQFVGNRVRLFANLSGEGGHAEISVDGGPSTLVDTFASVNKTDLEVWDSGPLRSGTHTLSVVVRGTAGTDAWVDLDRAIVQSAAPATVNDTAVGDEENEVLYSGVWHEVTGARDGRYGGTSHRSNTAGSTATIAFVGSHVAIRANLFPAGGRARVVVDGGAATLMDCYAHTSATDRPVWMSGPLPYGRHIVTIIVLDTADPASTDAWVDIDRFDLS